MTKLYKSSGGFGVIEIILAVAVVGVLGFTAWHYFHNRQPGSGSSNTAPGTAEGTVVPGGTNDVAYGPEPLQKLDVATPANGKTHPIVIVIHGGGWHAGDKSDNTWLAKRLSGDGYAVFNIDYRLSTKAVPGFPMDVDDVRMATKWVIDHAAAYQADPKNISMIGGSAGAHLAALASELINQETPGTVKKVVSMSGPMDFVALFKINSGAFAAVDQRGGVLEFLGCTSATCTQSQLQAASPYYHTMPSCPAFLMVNATTELVPVEQAETMHTKLVQTGCKSTLKTVPGKRHAFGNYNTVEADVLNFLKS